MDRHARAAQALLVVSIRRVEKCAYTLSVERRGGGEWAESLHVERVGRGAGGLGRDGSPADPETGDAGTCPGGGGRRDSRASSRSLTYSQRSYVSVGSPKLKAASRARSIKVCNPSG